MVAKEQLISPPKTNGFSRPFNRLQMLSWVLYGYLNVSFHAICGSYEGVLFVVLNGMHLLLSLAMFSSAYCATSANVVDEYIEERGFPTPTMTMKSFQDKYYDSLQRKELCWCRHCKWYVHRNAKHCRACNRCTDDFDHHCRWLNNCISSKNYHCFFVAIVSTEAMLLFEIAVGVLLVSGRIAVAQHLFIELANPTLIYGLIALHILIAGLMVVPNGQLIAFHLYLHRKQISTFEWVVARERAKEEEQKQQQEKGAVDGHGASKRIKSQIFASIAASIRQSFRLLRNCERGHCSQSDSTSNSESLRSPTKRGQPQNSGAPKRLLSVDTNAEVKLSGLSTNGSTEEIDIDSVTGPGPIYLEEAAPPTLSRLLCVSVSQCSHRPFKKRNRVQPPIDRHKKYSDEKHRDITNRADDVIFGPENAMNSQRMSLPLGATDENV